MAERNAANAADKLFEMEYSEADEIYQQALPIISENMFHKRMYARTLVHLGEWQKAAEYLQAAFVDSAVRNGIEADAERVRNLQKGHTNQSMVSGMWVPVDLKYAQENRSMAVVALKNGIVATSHPSSKSIMFWASSGQRISKISGVGTLAALSASGNTVIGADFSGNKIVIVGSKDQEAKVLDLNSLNIHGVRDAVVVKGGGFWVVDFGGGRVVRVGAAGKFITEIGNGDLDAPTAVLPFKGDLLVAESGNNRILRFTTSGDFVREYVHHKLNSPVDVVAVQGGFAVQANDGRIFYWEDGTENLVGPIKEKSKELITSNLGMSVDLWGNIWWSDGKSLRSARHRPTDLPFHLMEILKSKITRKGRLARVDMTASVMTKDGRPITSLDRRSFRVIKDQKMLLPIRVENLSENLAGRRVIIARENSDLLVPHEQSLRVLMNFYQRSLSQKDLTSILEIGDSFTTVRSYTVSSQLLSHAFNEKRKPVAPIDLQNFDALEYTVRSLAPKKHARGILWITSGENIDQREVEKLQRMGLINQVPFFIVHVGKTHSAELKKLAKGTQGDYYRLYSRSNPMHFFDNLKQIQSGRYIVSAEFALPEPQERGSWLDVSLESYFYTEGPTTLSADTTPTKSELPEQSDSSEVKKKNIARRLYDWTLQWAATPYGLTALILIAFAESSFFPIPPDVLLIAIVAAAPEKWWKAAALSTTGSVLGGIFGYGIGYYLWPSVSTYFFAYVPGFHEETFAKFQGWYEQWGVAIVFVAGFSPIPYKIFTICSGVTQMTFLPFVGASLVSRGARFFIVAGLLKLFGPPVRVFIEKYFDILALLFVFLLVGGFVSLKFLH